MQQNDSLADGQALVRHGEAEHNVGAEFCDGPAVLSVVGPALTELGQQQAAILPSRLSGLRLAPDIVLVSPQLRCLETAAQARAADDQLLQAVPLQLQTEAYEHAWHRENGGQIPPRELARWPAGRDRLLGDPKVLAAMAHRLHRVAGASADGSLAPDEDGPTAQARAARVLESMRARPEAMVLLIAHGGTNLDILGCLEPRWVLFGSYCQPNGGLIVVELPPS